MHVPVDVDWIGVDVSELTGDALVQVLATLGNSHRLRVVAALQRDRQYVSQLARNLGISRALLQVHLRRLEAAGLVSASVEVSQDGKAMKYYALTPFVLHLTPGTVADRVQTLTLTPPGEDQPTDGEEPR